MAVSQSRSKASCSALLCDINHSQPDNVGALHMPTVSQCLLFSFHATRWPPPPFSQDHKTKDDQEGININMKQFLPLGFHRKSAVTWYINK